MNDGIETIGTNTTDTLVRPDNPEGFWPFPARECAWDANTPNAPTNGDSAPKAG